MRQRIQRMLTAAVGLLLLLSASGCGFSLSPTDLYSLPQLPEEYTELNSSLNQLLESGAEYAAPVSGSNIQPVQLEDLDGDGEEEALAFFRNSADEKPLKIYIFTAGKQGYEQAAVIEGTGTSIYSIAYEDLDQDGRKELLVGWRVTTDLQALSREEILDMVWGRDYFGELKIVDVNIRRLRLKIEDNVQNPTYITTVWGYGYKWGF